MSESDGEWQVFDIGALTERLGEAPVAYHEFLRVPALSCGVYRLAAGSKDMQGVHAEDEVYYVLEGRGRLRVEQEERSVGPGSVLYVRASARHSFFEIEEDMTLLVFFASSPSGLR